MVHSVRSERPVRFPLNGPVKFPQEKGQRNATKEQDVPKIKRLSDVDEEAPHAKNDGGRSNEDHDRPKSETNGRHQLALPATSTDRCVDVLDSNDRRRPEYTDDKDQLVELVDGVSGSSPEHGVAISPPASSERTKSSVWLDG
jgi:hypothetical protein